MTYLPSKMTAAGQRRVQKSGRQFRENFGNDGHFLNEEVIPARDGFFFGKIPFVLCANIL